MQAFVKLAFILFCSMAALFAQSGLTLPDGKLIPEKSAVSINSLPTAIVLTRDGHYAITLNNGYGTQESGLQESLSVLDLQSNKVADFPDDRLKQDAKQSYFLGLALSNDEKHIYASMSSITDAEGTKPGSTGNGIAIYGFSDGKIIPEGFLKVPLQPLAPGKVAAKVIKQMPEGKLIPYPAGIAVVPGEHEKLLVADNLSDDALLLDVTTGEVLHRFDLSTNKIIPAAYPQSVAVTRDGKTGYVSLWNASAVAVLDLQKMSVGRIIRLFPPATSINSGSHPTALLLGPDEHHLYVTLANRDRVAIVDTKTFAVSTLDTKLPGATQVGATPSALAQSPDGKQLFVANATSNTVAFYDLTKPTSRSAAGFLPTEWYPQALAVANGELLVASGKGRGAGPNTKLNPGEKSRKKFPYILSLLHGSIDRINISDAFKDRASLTQAALHNNKAGAGSTKVFSGRANPIKHVIYIIKENRSYDQVFGDIAGANGDKSLVMFGEDITPNQHRLAREFGVLDNFYDSGDVSGNGHVWSTAAIDSDYLEKTLQIGYRSKERPYDYEGEVANRLPLEDDMADVNEQATGFIWGNVARHGLTYRHYGEFIRTAWCTREKEDTTPMEGSPWDEDPKCSKKEIAKGEPLPSVLGYTATEVSPWPWKVPLIAKNKATKPELRGHFDPSYPDFRLDYPDQLRVDEFLREFKVYVSDRDKGAAKALPNYILLRLGNDHTSGTKAGLATPAAAIADNDLAVGRVVEAISHSPYWDDTAILVLEDDAQDGPDHVDAHRSIALVISKYSPSSGEKPFVDSQFYCTINMLKTMESLLGIPPMNSNDANAAPIASLFSGRSHAPFTADHRNLDNGLLYKVNPPKGPGAAQSAAMDFTHADRADSATLNKILWENRMGDKPMPAPRIQKR